MSEKEETQDTPVDPDTLPATFPQLAELIIPEDLTENSSLDDHKRIAAQHINNALKATYAGWGQVRSINSICKLASLTADLVQKQRQLLLKPSTYTEYVNGKQAKKTFGFETLE